MKMNDKNKMGEDAPQNVSADQQQKSITKWKESLNFKTTKNILLLLLLPSFLLGFVRVHDDDDNNNNNNNNNNNKFVCVCVFRHTLLTRRRTRNEGER